MGNYLAYKIIKITERSKEKWKRDSCKNHAIPIQQKDFKQDNSRKSEVLKEAEEYERFGYIKRKLLNGKSDLAEIRYSDTTKEEFYQIVGCTPKYLRIEQYKEEVSKRLKKTKKKWIRNYYEKLLCDLENGKIPKEFEVKLSKDNFPSEEEMTKAFRRHHEYDMVFQCLEAVDQLETPMYKRVFSKKYFKDSKKFESELQKKIVSLVQQYGKADEDIYLDDNMKEQEILPQILLEEYGTTLNLKGSLKIILDGKEIDLGDMINGVELNSNSLKYAEISENQNIRKIITVENKANFMCMPYEKETLYIFSHGYPSPLERRFLCNLYEKLRNQEVEYYHTGDLDYGGICIFRFIRTKIFPKLKPYQMDLEIYYKYYETMGTPLGNKEQDTIRLQEKLKKIEEPLLQSLIDEIVRTGIGVEQESFLIK